MALAKPVLPSLDICVLELALGKHGQERSACRPLARLRVIYIGRVNMGRKIFVTYKYADEQVYLLRITKTAVRTYVDEPQRMLECLPSYPR